MITNFKLFESNMQINIDLPEDALNKLISTMTFMVYKGKKRNEKKHRNYKSIRMKSIDGYYTGDQLNHKSNTNEYSFNIEMTNGDKIEAKYSKISEEGNVTENSFYIEINGQPIYHLDNEDYEINSFIDMIGKLYQKYLESKKWKVR